MNLGFRVKRRLENGDLVHPLEAHEPACLALKVAEDAGLGGGLDQAEEAQLGITDEEIDAAVRKSLGLEPK